MAFVLIGFTSGILQKQLRSDYDRENATSDFDYLLR